MRNARLANYERDAWSEIDCRVTPDNDTESGEKIFVFSPGATSFGMFANEFDRGNKYMDEVKRIFK